MLKLAQLTQTNTIPLETTSIELGKVTPLPTSGSILAIAAPFVFFVVILVFWIIALMGAAGRKDLKENRWLWVALLLFTGYLGMVIYFFVENRKKLGWASVIILLVGLLPLFFLMF